MHKLHRFVIGEYDVALSTISQLIGKGMLLLFSDHMYLLSSVWPSYLSLSNDCLWFRYRVLNLVHIYVRLPFLICFNRRLINYRPGQTFIAQGTLFFFSAAAGFLLLCCFIWPL